ncbi:MAG: hypothetical protein ABJB04_07115, partial [Betaproteobacteria bacterium]
VPFAIAAVVLVPAVAFLIAMFVEGARRVRWTAPRTPARILPAPESRRETKPRAKLPALAGFGLRHGMAARRDHD